MGCLLTSRVRSHSLRWLEVSHICILITIILDLEPLLTPHVVEEELHLWCKLGLFRLLFLRIYLDLVCLFTMEALLLLLCNYWVLLSDYQRGCLWAQRWNFRAANYVLRCNSTFLPGGLHGRFLLWTDKHSRLGTTLRETDLTSPPKGLIFDSFNDFVDFSRWSFVASCGSHRGRSR